MTMRNRKAIIAAFLVLALMLVGVGYAAIGDDLIINGTATSGVQDFDVYFTHAEVVTVNDAQVDGVAVRTKVEQTYLEGTTTTATINSAAVNFVAEGLTVAGAAGDKVVVDFYIQNDNNYAWDLNPSITATTAFNVDGEFVEADGTTIGETTRIGAFDADSEDDVVIYRVTVTLKENSGSTSVTETFTITINGTAVTN